MPGLEMGPFADSKALFVLGYTVYAFWLPPEIAAGLRGFPLATEMQDLYVHLTSILGSIFLLPSHQVNIELRENC